MEVAQGLFEGVALERAVSILCHDHVIRDSGELSAEWGESLISCESNVLMEFSLNDLFLDINNHNWQFDALVKLKLILIFGAVCFDIINAKVVKTYKCFFIHSVQFMINDYRLLLFNVQLTVTFLFLSTLLLLFASFLLLLFLLWLLFFLGSSICCYFLVLWEQLMN